MSIKIKAGLVLSGGGAKGAYQVGLLKALIANDIEIQAISGASIGSLNGAVLACANNLKEGVDNLENLWRELASNDPIQVSYLRLLTGMGLNPTVMSKAANLVVASSSTVIPALKILNIKKLIETTYRTINNIQKTEKGILDNNPIHQLIEKHLNMDGLEKGIPLYVSLYPSKGWGRDILGIALSEMGITDNNPSVFKHIQSVEKSQRKKILMASAALPLLFDSIEIDGAVYTDGGQGRWNKMQGNTPIEPLIDAGCDYAVVSHLTNGSLWDRHDFKEIEVIEIRPENSFDQGKKLSLIDFSKSSIDKWIKYGYDDTMRTLEMIIRVTKAKENLIKSEQLILSNQTVLERGESIMNDAMNRLK